MVSVKLKKTVDFRGRRSTYLVERVLTGLYGFKEEVPEDIMDEVEHPMFIGRLPGKVHHICRKTKNRPKEGDEVRFYDGVKRTSIPAEVRGVQELKIEYMDNGNNRFDINIIIDGITITSMRTVGGVLVHYEPWVVNFVQWEGWPSVDMFIAQFPASCTYFLVHWGDNWYGPRPESEDDSVED